jgi:2-dehydro-3-deoxygluconokinase
VAGLDLVSIGEPLYELNRQPDGRYLPGFGGDTLNVCIAATRLGARCAYVSRLGADIFGDDIRALMIREGVDDAAVTTDPQAPTGLYFVTHGQTGHVFTYRRAGSAASLMSARDIPEEKIASARFVHASGISQAISASAAEAVATAFRMARASSAQVSYDTNFRPRLWAPEQARARVEEAAAMAHILKTSQDDALALFGLSEPAAIADHCLALGAGAVLVTLGAEGLLLATAAVRRAIPGHRVAAVDATGAGDAFTGAFLAELARGRTLAEAAGFANAAAALSTRGFGAIAPLPRRPEVERALASEFLLQARSD